MTASRTEISVPLDRRVLVLEGRLSPKAFDQVRAGLPAEARSDECFFARYTYADLPLPVTFAVSYDLADPRKMEPVAVKILAATRDDARPSPTLPAGDKTVVWLDAPGRDSTLLAAQPRVDDWFRRQVGLVGLASRETWEAVKAQAPELQLEAKAADPASPKKPFPWSVVIWSCLSGPPAVLLLVLYLGMLADSLFNTHGYRDPYGVMGAIFYGFILSLLSLILGGIALAVTRWKGFWFPLGIGLLSTSFWLLWLLYIVANSG